VEISEPTYFRPSRAWIVQVTRNKVNEDGDTELFDLYFTFDGEEAEKDCIE